MARGNRSRGRRDSGEATTQVDDRATAIEQAAAATVVDDAPDAVTTADDAVSSGLATEISVSREVDAALEGQDLELTDEQLAETLGTPPEDETASLLGITSIGDLKNRKPGEDLLGAEGDPDAPPDDPRQAAKDSQAFNPFGNRDDAPGAAQQTGGGGGNPNANTDLGGGSPGKAEVSVSAANPNAQVSAGSGGLGPDVVDAGVFDLISQPGETDDDPLSSFLDAAEAKLGRNLGATTPSDETNDTISGGSSVAAGWTAKSTQLEPLELRKLSVNDDAGIEAFEGPELKQVTDKNNGTITTLFPDGSTTTTTLGGAVIDQTPPLKQPGPDDDVAPIPEDIQRQLDSDVARLRAARPQTDDGTTDPSEIESEVVGPAGELPDRAEQAQDLFGRPDTEAPEGGGAANPNPGADPNGLGVITPGDDQTVATGPTRNDDPFANAGTAPEQVASSNDATSDFQAFRSSETTGTAIDDVPDLISDPA